LATALALVACGTPGQNPESSAPDAEATRIGYPTVEAALTAVRARPGVTESQSAGWTVIEDKAHHETWLFSPAASPVTQAKRSVKTLSSKRPRCQVVGWWR